MMHERIKQLQDNIRSYLNEIKINIHRPLTAFLPLLLYLFMFLKVGFIEKRRRKATSIAKLDTNFDENFFIKFQVH